MSSFTGISFLYSESDRAGSTKPHFHLSSKCLSSSPATSLAPKLWPNLGSWPCWRDKTQEPLQFSRAVMLRESRYRTQMSPEVAEWILGSTEEANPSAFPFFWLHSPHADDAQETRSRHSHQQPVPFPHQVRYQGQHHVPNAPEDAGQDPSEGAVLDVHPLHPWKREAEFSWDMQDFSSPCRAFWQGQSKTACPVFFTKFHRRKYLEHFWHLENLSVQPQLLSSCKSVSH